MGRRGNCLRCCESVRGFLSGSARVRGIAKSESESGSEYGRDGQCANENENARDHGRDCARENESGLRESAHGHDHDPHVHGQMLASLPC